MTRLSSVAPQEHFTHIPLKTVRAKDPQTLTAINGENINIYGIKEVTLVYKNLAIPTTCIISDVNRAILGLDTITTRTIYSYNNHFHLKATIFDGLYDYVDYTPDFTNWYYNWHDKCDSNNKVYGLLQDDVPGQPVYNDYIVGDESQQEADIARTYKSPILPTQQEIDEHSLTH
eukprot:6188835-Amphidinium_carterae.1